MEQISKAMSRGRGDRRWTARPKIDLSVMDSGRCNRGKEVEERDRSEGQSQERGGRVMASSTSCRVRTSRMVLLCTSILLLSSSPVSRACKPAFHDHGGGVVPLSVPSASPPYSAFGPQLHPSASYPSTGKKAEDVIVHHKEKLGSEHSVNVILGEFVGEDVQVGGGGECG